METRLAVADDLDPAGPLDHEQVPVVARRLGDVDGLVEFADLLEANAPLPVAGGRLPLASVGLAGRRRRRCGGRGRASASASASREHHDADDQEGWKWAPAAPEAAHARYVIGRASRTLSVRPDASTAASTFRSRS